MGVALVIVGMGQAVYALAALVGGVDALSGRASAFAGRTGRRPRGLPGRLGGSVLHRALLGLVVLAIAGAEVRAVTLWRQRCPACSLDRWNQRRMRILEKWCVTTCRYSIRRIGQDVTKTMPVIWQNERSH